MGASEDHLLTLHRRGGIVL